MYPAKNTSGRAVHYTVMTRTSTQRFSDRVEDYVRYRPGYPAEILPLLREECQLTPSHVVADIASGTGIWTKQLLENGNRVFAVEPNAEMRGAGEQLLRPFPNLASMDGTAEETNLAAHSIDLVTAAQAAHWFDRVRARKEFVRIMKPGAFCVLLWNERRTDATPFLRDYERLLLDFGTDYKEVRHERTTAVIHEFFAPAPCRERAFELRQTFDYESAAGRLLSSSYAPLADHPNHAPMMKELRRMFDAHAFNGRIEFEYNTRVFYGHL